MTSQPARPQRSHFWPRQKHFQISGRDFRGPHSRRPVFCPSLSPSCYPRRPTAEKLIRLLSREKSLTRPEESRSRLEF